MVSYNKIYNYLSQYEKTISFNLHDVIGHNYIYNPGHRTVAKNRNHNPFLRYLFLKKAQLRQFLSFINV